MKEYKAPQLTKIVIQSGISFAAYTCTPSITDVYVDGKCSNPVIDADFGGWYCYDGPTAPTN